MHNLLLITSDTTNILDEGRQKSFKNIFLHFKILCKVKAISLRGEKIDADHQIIGSNRFFASLKIREFFKSNSFDDILYFPTESVTLGTMLRITIIYLFKKRATELNLFILQHSTKNSIQKKVIPVFFQLFNLNIISASKQFCEDFPNLDVKTQKLGVDTEKYYPVNSSKKSELRQRWGFNDDEFIVLHVGHLSANRNIDELINLKKDNNDITFVFVSSSLKKSGEEWKKKIDKSNIILIDKYVGELQELYQLSDLYIFMVKDECGAISYPLSVLEALACGIPVISRLFGMLSTFQSNNELIYFYNSYLELNIILNKVRKSKTLPSIHKANDLSWNAVVKEIQQKILHN